MGFGVWGSGFGFGVWGSGFGFGVRGLGLGFGVRGSGEVLVLVLLDSAAGAFTVHRSPFAVRLYRSAFGVWNTIVLSIARKATPVIDVCRGIPSSSSSRVEDEKN